MKKNSGFERFYTEKKGAAKKEQFRQEKRKWKKERQEDGDRKIASWPAIASPPIHVDR